MIYLRFFVIFQLTILCTFGFFAANVLASGIETQAYVMSSKADTANMQSMAIKKGLKLAIKKIVKSMIGKIAAKNYKNKATIEKNIYKKDMNYIYSFKIIEAKDYLNLYYVKLDVLVRRKILSGKLKSLGFKIINRADVSDKRSYAVYYVKFIGNFKYSETNELQKLMIQHSKHLKNLYISSFSDNFIEIKIKYFGSIIRLVGTIKKLTGSYLKEAHVYPTKGSTIVVDVLK